MIVQTYTEQPATWTVRRAMRLLETVARSAVVASELRARGASLGRKRRQLARAAADPLFRS